MSIRPAKYYDTILVLFVVTLVLSNLAATKLVIAGPFILDGGAVLFPLMYILADIMTEVYGYDRMRRALHLGFAVMMLAVFVFTVVRFLPYPESYTSQAAFDAIFGFLPRIVVASLVAYLVGGFVNAYILAKMKVAMKGKKLWARLLGSTIAGELLDTVLFCIIAFGGIISSSEMINYILVGWVFKTLVEAVLLPVTYRCITWLKKHERIDVYDRKTNFSPFIS